MIDVIFRNVLDVMGDDTVLVVPPGCAAQFSGCGPEASVTVAGVQGNLENSAAIASGIANGFKHQGNDHTQVVVIAGDGGTVDIGLQSLSGAKIFGFIGGIAGRDISDGSFRKIFGELLDVCEGKADSCCTWFDVKDNAMDLREVEVPC